MKHLRRLMCFLGFHKWEFNCKYPHYVDKICMCCGEGLIAYNYRKHRVEQCGPEEDES